MITATIAEMHTLLNMFAVPILYLRCGALAPPEATEDEPEAEPA